MVKRPNNKLSREFPGGPGVKTRRFHCQVRSLVGELRSLQATQHGLKKKNLVDLNYTVIVCKLLVSVPSTQQALHLHELLVHYSCCYDDFSRACELLLVK